MATDATSGPHGAGHGDIERRDFLSILFTTVSLMGIAAILWCFAAALGPVESGPTPAPRAQALMSKLR